MNRRTMIASLAALGYLAPASRAEAPPYRVSLIGDAFDGKAWAAGIRVELAEGWKTYWRMPGDAGIPPEFNLRASAPADIEVLFPLPTRFDDASGESVGYKHEVIFPILVRPRPFAPLHLTLDLFLGVCREVCIPVRVSAALSLGSASRDPLGNALVADWTKRVPVPTDFARDPVISSSDGKTVLELTLDQPVDDIYAEAAHGIYVHRPQFYGGKTARLELANVREASSLRGAVLKLTARRGEAGLEQTITLP